MKIIEALKELPLLAKRIEKNQQLLRQYSSAVDNGTGQFNFGNEDAQRQEVASLLQSTLSLIQRRAEIRRDLALTNASVQVVIGNITHSITEWIEYRTFGTEAAIQSFNALNGTAADGQLKSMNVDLSKGVRVVFFYDEKSRNTKIDEFMQLRSQIDATLEIVNATTDLIEHSAAVTF